MKTFTNVVEEKLGSWFEEFKVVPSLASNVMFCVPASIAAYLHDSMLNSKNPDVELFIYDADSKIMKFSLNASKKGDSIAFNPSFELLPAGEEYLNSDEVDFGGSFLTKCAKSMLTNNKEFIDICSKVLYGYTLTNGEWKEVEDDDNGMRFDEEIDLALSISCVLFTLFEILCNNKDASNDLEYEVANLGKFKVSPVKNGYSMTLTYDKEFKAACKSDKLSEAMFEVLE